jgi:hypothetical protein
VYDKNPIVDNLAPNFAFDFACAGQSKDFCRTPVAKVFAASQSPPKNISKVFAASQTPLQNFSKVFAASQTPLQNIFGGFCSLANPSAKHFGGVCGVTNPSTKLFGDFCGVTNPSAKLFGDFCGVTNPSAKYFESGCNAATGNFIVHHSKKYFYICIIKLLKRIIDEKEFKESILLYFVYFVFRIFVGGAEITDTKGRFAFEGLRKKHIGKSNRPGFASAVCKTRSHSERRGGCAEHGMGNGSGAD